LADIKSTLKGENPEEGKFTRVMPNILLSGESGARNAPTLDRERVTHLISCFATTENHGKQCLALRSEDEPYYPMLQHMEEVTNFLRTLKQHSRCLIYCRLGVNRSAALAIALLMRYRFKKHPQISAEELFHNAFRDVHVRHGRVLTNYGFQRQLLLYAHNGCRWCNDWGPETWLLQSSSHLDRAYRVRLALLRALQTAHSDEQKEARDLSGIVSRFAYEWMRRERLCITPSMYKT